MFGKRKLERLKEQNRHQEEMIKLRGQYPIDENEVRDLVKKYTTETKYMPMWRETTITKKIEENEVIEIPTKYKLGGASLYFIPQGDWIDLENYEEVNAKAGDFQLIDLGIAMQLPQGYEAILAPRSSTFKKYGILQANSIGVIDNSYCGDDDWWMLAAYFTRDITISKGTRIAQFRIQKNQPKLKFIPVETLGNNSRSGFGSTGD